MNKIKQLEKQIIKERKELPKLRGMDWFAKAAHIYGLHRSIIIHSISQLNPNLLTPTVNENPEKYIMKIKVISQKEALRIYPKKGKPNLPKGYKENL